MLKKHYSPGIPVLLNKKRAEKNCALITFGKKYEKFIVLKKEWKS